MQGKKTHIQVFIKDKEKLEKIRNKKGYASMAVVISKLLEKRI